MTLTHEDVRKILALIDESDYEEVHIEFGDLKLDLRRRGDSSDSDSKGSCLMPKAGREKVKHRITRLFVANRGEIAVRIVEACRKLGIETVMGVSDADRQTLAAKMADPAICVGPARAAESYLRMETIVTAAQGTGCQAIHPGYGFLAENAKFQSLCEEQGLIFVGPPASAISNGQDMLRFRYWGMLL